MMPLLDHFRPPLAPRRHWESFLASWAGAIADQLNKELLPRDYFAEELSGTGARVEIDVATFKNDAGAARRNGAVGVAAKLWSPPAPHMVMPAIFPGGFEVRVYSSEGGAKLVAAVELISPANKDRPETRRAFFTKCANYLYQGIGLIIVDVVTTRQANLHNELVEFMQIAGSYSLPEHANLYAVAYRPIQREAGEIDIWWEKLSLGRTLPVMPLALNAELCLPLNLEAAYTDVCSRRRLP